MANPIYILWKILLLADTCTIYIGNCTYTKIKFVNKVEWTKTNTDTWERNSVNEEIVKKVLIFSNILNKIKINVTIDSFHLCTLIQTLDFWSILTVELTKHNYKEQYDITTTDAEKILTKFSEYRYDWTKNNSILQLETDINQINIFKEKEKKKLMQKSCLNAAIVAKHFQLPCEIRNIISRSLYYK